MKNLFDFATKELSQDAFLRWILANYDDPELKDITYDLLREFCKFSDDERVVELTSKPQWKKIDITIQITTNKRKLALYIEDKTFSNEHNNQLERYNKYIQSESNWVPFRIFYKTSILEKWEKAAVRKAQWELYDIDRIIPLFEKYKQSANLIVCQYVEHIKKLHDAIHNAEKPQKNDGRNEWLQWSTFFNQAIVDKMKPHHHDLIFWVMSAGRYPYTCLCMKKAGMERNIPYLEIQSRDCTDDKFHARILCHGISDEDLKRNQQKLIDKIKCDGVVECKGLVTRKKGHDIFPKQIGYTRKGLYAKTTDEFLRLVEEYATYYLQVMSLWE